MRSTPGGSRLSVVLAAAALAGAIWLVYARSVSAPFIFDDGDSVVRNASIVRIWPLVGNAETRGPLDPAKELPTSGRPMVNLSLALNFYFGGLDPTGYHIFNCVLHWLSAVLVAAIVRRVLRLDYFGSRFEQSAGALGFAVALVWAVHPLVTETVEYVTQRTELMVGFFYLATIYASLRFWAAETKIARAAWLIAAALSCLAGMASKEVMATAPILVLLIERTFIARSFLNALRRSWPLYIGLAGGWLLLAALNWSGPRARSAGYGLGVSAPDWWMTQSKVLWMYLRLTVWPWPLAIHYTTAYLHDLSDAWPSVFATAALIAVTAIFVWRRSAVGLALACVLVILSPTLVVPVIKEVAAERRMYLPLLGIIAILITGAYRLVRWVFERANLSIGAQAACIIAAGLVVAVPLGIVSQIRLKPYKDEIGLWTDTVHKQPSDFLAHMNLGNVLMRVDRDQEALAEYNLALELKRDFTEARVNRAGVLIKLNRDEEALDELRKVLAAGEPYALAYLHLGSIALRAGRPAEAIDYFRKAEDIAHDQAEIRLRIGDWLTAFGQAEEGARHYEEATRLMPPDAYLENNLGNALASAGRTREAAEHFQRAVELKPDWAEAEFNLATALLSLEHADEAIVHFEKTLRLSPKYAAAEYNLGNALVLAGKEAEAIDHFGKAIELKPTFVEAYANQALALARLGQSAGAIRTAEKAAALAAEQRNVELLTKIRDWLAAYRAEHPDLSPDSN